MRTKNIKRHWPVPMTLAVVALAAFLAFGLLATSGLQPAAADTGDVGHCTDGVEHDHAEDIACNTTGDSLGVKFTGAATETGIWVYTTGVGSVPTDDVTEGVTIDAVAADKVDVGEIGVVIAATDSLGRVQSQTVQVNRGDANKSGKVRLFVVASTNRVTTLSAEPPTLATTDAFTVTITFLGAPAATVDQNEDGDLTDPGDVDASTLLSLLAPNTTPATTIASGTNSATITATIDDANGVDLNGTGKAAGGQVTFTVTFAAGSDLEASTRSTYESDVIVAVDRNTAPITVSGWTTGTDAGPVSVTVTADYTGPTGSLSQEITLTRAGAPTSLAVATYNCDATEDPDKTNDGCAATKKPTADVVFGRENTVHIIGKFSDNLGTSSNVVVAGVDASIEMAGETATSLTAALLDSTDASKGFAISHTFADDAAYGTYTVTVSTGADEAKVEEVRTITVGGPPVDYSFVEPAANISLGAGSSAKFTVKAVDDNGNVPDFGDDNMVEVIVRGAGPNDVFGLENNLLELDEDTGEGTFEIFTPINAVDGQMAQIIVRTTDGVQAAHAITFGEAVVPEPKLTAPTGVTATADAGTVTVTWTDGADALGHLVLLFNADFSGEPMVNNAPTGSSAEFMDVAAGDYVAVVVSYRSGSEYMYDYMSVTVN